jgi:predicted Na+-dependent transporter
VALRHLDTIAAPFLVPGTLSLLCGAKVALDMTGMAVSLVLIVVIPTILGVAINEASRGKIPARISPYFNPFSKICLMLVIAANASAVRVSFDRRALTTNT